MIDEKSLFPGCVLPVEPEFIAGDELKSEVLAEVREFLVQAETQHAEIEIPPVGDLYLGAGHRFVIGSDLPRVLPGEDVEEVFFPVMQLLLEGDHLLAVKAVDGEEGHGDLEGDAGEHPEIDLFVHGPAGRPDSRIDEKGPDPERKGERVGGFVAGADGLDQGVEKATEQRRLDDLGSFSTKTRVMAMMKPVRWRRMMSMSRMR